MVPPVISKLPELELVPPAIFTAPPPLRVFVFPIIADPVLIINFPPRKLTIAPVLPLWP
jgi:hypothetical protein